MRLLLFSFLFVLSVESYNVLIYNPKFGHSHMKFMNQIGVVLQEAGHNVTVLHPKTNDLERDLKFTGRVFTMPQDPRTKVLVDENMNNPDGKMTEMWTKDFDAMHMFKMTDLMTNMYNFQCESNMRQIEILRELNKTRFDIAIAEVFDSCGHGIFEMLNIRSVIATSSSILIDHQAELFGVPIASSYVPGGFGAYGEKMSLVERGMNAFGSILGSRIFMGIIDAQTKAFRQHVSPDFKDLRELISSSSFLMTNSIPIVDFPRPTIHKVVDIGGIGVPTTKPLDKEWDEILNRRSQNVYISFGSVAKAFTMPKHYKESIIQMVRQMKEVTFIWKYEKDDLTDLPDNLVLSKWTPQRDLLSDKRISLFVTHGGLGSTTEIATSGCSALVIPLFGDQMRNSQMIRRHGGVETFSKYDIPNTHKLKEAIQKMLNDQSYKGNAVKLSNLIKNSPFTAKELLVKHVEFAAKFGSLPQLDPFGRKMSFVQYFLLDVVGLVVGVILSALTIIFFLFRAICRRTTRKLKTN